jgi:hypothetical protein
LSLWLKNGETKSAIVTKLFLKSPPTKRTL